MKIIIATFEARPDQIEAVGQTLRSFVANASREPGTLTYNLSEDPKKPGRFVFYERYIDQAAVDAHSKQSWLADGFRTLRPLLERPPIVEFFDEVATADQHR